MTGTGTAESAEDAPSTERNVAEGTAWVSEAERDLAQRSAAEFERGRWSACLSLLRQLSAARPNDPKVIHNVAVTRFYQSHFTDVEEFHKSLSSVSGQAQLSLGEIDNLDDVDHCIVCYNQAVLLFHEHQYYGAIALLDKMFQFIEPVEETLARKVCCLLLELSLRTFQMDKGLCLINYAENVLLNHSAVSGNNSKCHSPDKEKEKSDKESSGSKESTEKTATVTSREAFRARLQQYKARFYLMSKSMRFCKRELKSLMSSFGPTVFTVYVKSNLEYLRGNYRKALKVLNSAPYQFSSAKAGGENMAVMYYNNVGCIHFYMGKPLLGCHYFQRALAEDRKARTQRSQGEEEDKKGLSSASSLNNSRHYELLFNLGLQLLQARKPAAAFDCLVEAIQVYPTNLRLWLRLAESCIMVHKRDNAAPFEVQPKNIIQGCVGVGLHRKIVLSSDLSSKESRSEVQSAAMPMPTLEFAYLCLKNALLLLHEDTQSQGSTSGNYASDDADATVPGTASEMGSDQCLNCLPSNPIRGQEIVNLRISVLVASSYVALSLGDVVMALHYAETLLAHPKLSGVHKLLGHLYAGEALVLLDRISDAIEHFSPDLIKDVPLTIVSCEKDEKEKTTLEFLQERVMEDWFPNSSSSARTIMQYNLAVAFALRGEYEKATESLQQMGIAQVPCSNVPIQAVMLLMYLQLQQGYSEATKNIIKQYIPQLK